MPMPTKVIFRRFKKSESGDIVALFPEIPHDSSGLLCLSYAHVGQHGGASPAIFFETKPADARDKDVIDMVRELAAIGYSLDIRRKITRQMTDTRCREAKRLSNPD